MSSSPSAAEDESSLLQGVVQHSQGAVQHSQSRMFNADYEVDFVVTRDHLSTTSPGLAYRKSMSFGDKDPGGQVSLWGSTVRGVPIGEAWVKVGHRFLPVRVQGKQVLERATEYYAPTEFTEASFAPASLIRTRQLQPPEAEATEQAAAEEEVTEQQQETTDSEATEQEATEEEVTEQEQEATDSEATSQEATGPEATEPENNEQQASESEDDEPEAAELESSEHEEVEAGSSAEVEPLSTEPQPFDGVVVQFGVLFRSFPTLNYQSGTFTTSLTLTQRWPTNADVSSDGENPWSPNLLVMNHDIRGIETVSTSTHVNQTDGMTTQVDYLIVRVRQVFELKQFPFDRQTLSIRVAPASSGSVNIKLVPMQIPEERVLEPELVEDHGFHVASVVESGSDDLSITLSTPARGVIEVALDRRASAYFSSLFFPAFLLLCISWCIFFVPVPDPAFAVPRVAVTTGAFVAMLLFNLHVEQMVPARFGCMWIDVFTENIGILVFAVVAFNTLEQYVHSNMGRPFLASVLSFELRIFYPVLCAFVLGVCFFAPWEYLTVTSAACRFSLAIGIFGYIGKAYRRALDGEEDKLRSPVGLIRSPR